jgi:hypothetical protein
MYLINGDAVDQPAISSSRVSAHLIMAGGGANDFCSHEIENPRNGIRNMAPSQIAAIRIDYMYIEFINWISNYAIEAPSILLRPIVSVSPRGRPSCHRSTQKHSARKRGRWQAALKHGTYPLFRVRFKYSKFYTYVKR